MSCSASAKIFSEIGGFGVIELARALAPVCPLMTVCDAMFRRQLGGWLAQRQLLATSAMAAVNKAISEVNIGCAVANTK
jgi:hypothetical protein